MYLVLDGWFLCFPKSSFILSTPYPLDLAPPQYAPTLEAQKFYKRPGT